MAVQSHPLITSVASCKLCWLPLPRTLSIASRSSDLLFPGAPTHRLHLLIINHSIYYYVHFLLLLAGVSRLQEAGLHVFADGDTGSDEGNDLQNPQKQSGIYVLSFPAR